MSHILYILRIRGQKPRQGLDTDLPFYDFHKFAAAYGWTFWEWCDAPRPVLAYCEKYIDSDEQVQQHRLAQMRKAT